MKFVTRAAITFGLGTALAIAPATMALAADHEASVTEGFTSISLNLGTDAANARTGIVIVGIDTDAADPDDSDVVYANEITANELGVATLRITLPSAELEDYRILANYAGGSLYSAPLAEVDGGDGGGDGDGGNGDGDGGDGDPGGDGDGTGGGDSGDGSGDGSGNAGDGSGDTPDGTDPGQGSATDHLSDTGASAGWVAAAAVVGSLLVATGITLLVRKRRHA